MKGRYIHPDEHRGFNTVELMRLQAFPKDFRFSGGLISVGRQIGNAVPPPLAEAIGLAIRAQLERLP
jgi:DNA (cytosine-5)-methyltransferase 1